MIHTVHVDIWCHQPPYNVAVSVIWWHVQRSSTILLQKISKFDYTKLLVTATCVRKINHIILLYIIRLLFVRAWSQDYVKYIYVCSWFIVCLTVMKFCYDCLEWYVQWSTSLYYVHWQRKYNRQNQLPYGYFHAVSWVILSMK